MIGTVHIARAHTNKTKLNEEKKKKKHIFYTYYIRNKKN